MNKKFRVVKEVQANSIVDAMKKEGGFEPCEVYEIGDDSEEKRFIGFKPD